METTDPGVMKMASEDGAYPADRKSIMRREMRRIRAALTPAERASNERKMAARLHLWCRYLLAKKIVFYASFGTEVSTRSLVTEARRHGKTVCLPRVEGQRLDIVPITWSGITPTNLRPGYRNISEPCGGAISPGSLDIVVVPGLAFDRRGYRMGYGGGYYDRLLARLPSSVASLGLAYGAQLVDAIPIEPHDLAVDWILTETGLRPAGGPG